MHKTLDLPVPYDALLQLGLSHEQIVEAEAKRPSTVANQASQRPGAYYSVPHAQRALRGLAAFRHTKGRWAGTPLKLGEGLDPWQVVWIIAPIFGWVYDDQEINRTVRVIRTAWIEVPRKNGKSTISSALSGLLLLGDQEPGAEVYAAAGSTDQARRVFDDAKTMMERSPVASRHIVPLSSVIRVPRSNSMMRVLSKVAETAHGLNVSGAVIDEMHVLRNQRKLVEAIDTGVGARDQPLIVYITTADEAEVGTIYDEKHVYTKNVALKILEDPSHYGVIWAADKDDDIFDEAVMLKANPGAPKSPRMDYLRGEALKAKSSPAARQRYRQLSLNIRDSSGTRWIDVERWTPLGKAKRSTVRGARAWAGLDLSATSDFSAWAVWAQSNNPDHKLELFTRFWIPEERIGELQDQLKIPLQSWVDRGYVKATEGDVIDYGIIKKDILRDAKYFDLQRISYDRMFAGQMVQELDEELRVDIVSVAQTFYGLSPATKELDRLYKAEEMIHDASPVMRWMSSVVEVKTDDADNIRPIKPDRKKSTARIDGFQAAVTGLDGIVRTTLEQKQRFIATGSSTRKRRQIFHES